MKTRSKIVTWAAFMLLFAVAVFVVMQNKKTGSLAEGEPTKIRIGYRAIASNIPLFVALEQGYFKDHGIDVEPVRFETADAGMDALIRGDVTTDFSSPLMVFMTREQQLPGTLMIYGFQMDTPGHSHEGLIVASDSTIQMIDDLKGKPIATFPGVAAKAYFEECLKKAGFEDKDILLRPLQASLHIQALQSRQVDAIFAYEPVLSLGHFEGWGRIVERALFPKYIQDPMPVTVFPILRSFVEENPKTATSITEAIGDAINFINKNPKVANHAMIKYTSLKEMIVVENVGQMLNVLARDADLRIVQAFADWHAKKGLVSGTLQIKNVIFIPNE